MSWYRKAAEQGHAEAQYKLSLMYIRGEGVLRDDQESMRWLRRAAEGGHAEAQYDLGNKYQTRGQFETLHEELDREAVKWFRLAAEQGHAGAQESLGYMYAEGSDVLKNEKEAVSWYLKAADQGSSYAQSKLAHMYAFGKGVPQDHVKAYAWHMVSARGNQRSRPWWQKRRKPSITAGQMAEAQKLASELGERIEASKSESLEIMLRRQAAAQGLASAQYKLGVMYGLRRGPQNHREGVRWLRRAAEQEHAEAQEFLGNMYLSGEGVPLDRTEAVKWYREAADGEHPAAQLTLGNRYATGRGVHQDYQEARKWYWKAAALQEVEALERLGDMYATGEGVQRVDYVQAYAWYILLAGFELAGFERVKGAIEKRDRLREKMTDGQVTEARALVAELRERLTDESSPFRH